MADKPPCSIAECIHQWGTKKLGVGTGMRRRPSEVAPTGLLGNLIRERREPEILGVEQTETLFRSRISANPNVFVCVYDWRTREWLPLQGAALPLRSSICSFVRGLVYSHTTCLFVFDRARQGRMLGASWCAFAWLLCWPLGANRSNGQWGLKGRADLRCVPFCRCRGRRAYAFATHIPVRCTTERECAPVATWRS